MKKILCLIFLLTACSQEKPTGILISNSDSKILFNGVPVAEIESVLRQKNTYVIQALADTLEVEDYKLTILEDSLNDRGPRDSMIFLPRNLTIALDDQLPYYLFYKIVKTCGRKRFDELLIRGTPLGETTQREIPFHLPLIYLKGGSKFRLKYKIIVDPTGFYILSNDGTFQHRDLIQLDDQGSSGILRISKVSGQYDFRRLQKEVSWICDEVTKIGFNGHKDFLITPTDSTYFQTTITVMEAVLQSGNQKTIPVRASMLDIANRKEERRDALIQRRTSQDDSENVSIDIGRLIDWHPEILSSQSEDEARQALLCLDDLLCWGIETDNPSLVKNAINRGAFLNTYVNRKLVQILTGGSHNDHCDSLIGFTPLMLAIYHNRAEMVQTLVDLGVDVNKLSLEHTESYRKWMYWEIPGSGEPPQDVRKFLSKSALKLAYEKGNKEIIDILKKAGAH